MGRGPLSKKVKEERTLSSLKDWLASVGAEPEAVEEIKKPDESVEDKLREAESVLIYFSTKGESFKEKTCKTCGGKFAYLWNVSSISNCSIECAKEALKQIGLTWDPSKDQARRWGPSVPVVVPPQALLEVKRSLDSQEDPPSDML